MHYIHWQFKSIFVNSINNKITPDEIDEIIRFEMSIAQFMICGDFEGICNLNFSVILRPFSEAIQISSASNSDLSLMSLLLIVLFIVIAFIFALYDLIIK